MTLRFSKEKIAVVILAASAIAYFFAFLRGLHPLIPLAITIAFGIVFGISIRLFKLYQPTAPRLRDYISISILLTFLFELFPNSFYHPSLITISPDGKLYFPTIGASEYQYLIVALVITLWVIIKFIKSRKSAKSKTESPKYLKFLISIIIFSLIYTFIVPIGLYQLSLARLIDYDIWKAVIRIPLGTIFCLLLTILAKSKEIQKYTLIGFLSFFLIEFLASTSILYTINNLLNPTIVAPLDQFVIMNLLIALTKIFIASLLAIFAYEFSLEKLSAKKNF